ncbi:MAG: hypothetical protein LC107_10730 [Chitinophagales bacterium]|nr:hypothetical protein [Chitinophagales bacterium]
MKNAILSIFLLIFVQQNLFSQCPCGTSNELQCAANYLHSKGILDSPTNIKENDNIIRQDLAKIAFIGLYGSVSAITPADSFPTPFADLQGNWIEYYKYAKALSYLEYQDGIPPFSRVFYNFRPTDGITRKLIGKVFVEAFNMPVSSATSSSYADVNAAYANGTVTLMELQYIETLRDAGAINPGTNFRPNDLAKRGETFLILYRLLCNYFNDNPLPLPNHAVDGDYFIPGNYHPDNLMNKPTLSDANFDAYSKVSFNIPGRNLPLVFSHNYNSHLTELPDELFPVLPLTRGWSHSYNSYIKVVPGYTGPVKSMPDRFVVVWPGGSMYDFVVNGSNGIPVSKGVYDNISYSANKITIKTKNQMVYTFEKITTKNNAPFMLKSIKDRNDNTVLLNYQAGTNKLTEVIDTGGRKLKFQYITAGPYDFLTQIEDPIGRIVSFDYDMATYDLSSYTDAEGKVTTYLYGTNHAEAHLLKNITLPNGNTIDNEYENRKLKSSKTNNASTGQKIKTDVDWGLKNGVYAGTSSTMKIDDGSNVRDYHFEQNGLGNLTSMLSPTIAINNLLYEDSNNPTKTTSIEVEHVPTKYKYDVNGNVIQITRPEAIIEKMTYTNFNDISSYTNGRNLTTNFTYDNKGNLKQINKPIGTTNISYNSFGQPIDIINPEGIKINLSYNVYGNVNSITYPGGIIAGMTYDGASRGIELINPNQQVSKLEYNPRDFVVKTTDAMNYITQFRYDDNGNLTEIENAKNEVTTMTYDQNDFLRSTSFGGFTRKYDYDEEGKLLKVTKPDNTVFNYVYDNDKGNLIDDGYATYTYDSRNRIKTVTKHSKAIIYSYDDLDRVISIEYDGETVGYEYDKNSNVTKVIYPDGMAVIYTYDANDRMETVTDWNGKKTVYEYYKDDRLKVVWLPNGTAYAYEYDAAGRAVKLINYHNGGVPWIRYIYTLDKNGNHLSEEKFDEPFANPTISTESFSYAYNNINQLMTVTGDMGTNLSWSYDANGNTISRNGTSYTWDSHDMLIAYNDGTNNFTFKYDGQGHRREANRNSIVYKYSLDILGMSKVLAEKDGSGNYRNYYVYGLTLISNVKPDGTTYYYHPDFRGSVMAMTDASQHVVNAYSYDEYGQITDIMETVYNPFRYVGMLGVMYETNQLVFMRARYYDPKIGRFLSEDPIWSTNLYPYADNNPISFADPSGFVSWELIGIGALGIVGGMATIMLAPVSLPLLITSGIISTTTGGAILLSGAFVEKGSHEEKILKDMPTTYSGMIGLAIGLASYDGDWEKAATIGAAGDLIESTTHALVGAGKVSSTPTKVELISLGADGLNMQLDIVKFTDLALYAPKASSSSKMNASTWMSSEPLPPAPSQCLDFSTLNKKFRQFSY